MTPERIAIIGAGRVGLTLARALVHSRRAVAVLGRHPQLLADPLGPVVTGWDAAIASAGLVLIAVPDDAIASVAFTLARTGAISAGHVVLHTSGLHDRSALAALSGSGAALGSWHPLQSFIDAAGEPARLPGSPAVIEGDARALVSARELAGVLGLAPVVEVAADRKASYHAAAVFASNYVVALADVADRLARDAADAAWPPALFLPLIERTVANLGQGTAAALTGPIRRGDAGTVERHLQALEEPERGLYILLARETLRIARDGGLADGAAQSIERLLY